MQEERADTKKLDLQVINTTVAMDCAHGGSREKEL